jgi:hypothetical protein
MTVQATVTALYPEDAATVKVTDHTHGWSSPELASVAVSIGGAMIFVQDLGTLHAIQGAFETAERLIVAARNASAKAAKK